LNSGNYNIPECDNLSRQEVAGMSGGAMTKLQKYKDCPIHRQAKFMVSFGSKY
jgi:hypothetical protein